MAMFALPIVAPVTSFALATLLQRVRSGLFKDPDIVSGPLLQIILTLDGRDALDMILKQNLSCFLSSSPFSLQT